MATVEKAWKAVTRSLRVCFNPSSAPLPPFYPHLPPSFQSKLDVVKQVTGFVAAHRLALQRILDDHLVASVPAHSHAYAREGEWGGGVDGQGSEPVRLEDLDLLVLTTWLLSQVSAALKSRLNLT